MVLTIIGITILPHNAFATTYQALNNTDFVDGIGTDATYWSGNDNRITMDCTHSYQSSTYGCTHETIYDTDYIYQTLTSSVDSDLFISASIYYWGHSIRIGIKYSSGTFTVHDCNTYTYSYTLCELSSASSNKYITAFYIWSTNPLQVYLDHAALYWSTGGYQ